VVQAKKAKIKAYIDQLTREKSQAAERAAQLEGALTAARAEAEALTAQCAARDAQIAQLNHQVT
jgi:predicted  nucleic acid-binding Zn-ribbon protein